MTIEEYQKLTQSTAVYPWKGTLQGVIYATLGLSGEAGELCNKLKKVIRDDGSIMTAERRLQLIDELGDVLWYVAALATELNVDLELVAKNNIAKLSNRFAKGTLHGSGDSR